MSEIRIKIAAKIDDIRYECLINSSIKTIHLDNFNINDSPSSCIVNDGKNEIAISKWVSPKRTRSYPYARVYDTISINKRATVIPVVKDEGLDGDRDFLQWDTICLMSLLQVAVIISYYETAQKHSNYQNKVTNQKFNNAQIKEKIEKLLSSYQSDALHWNIRQLREEFLIVIRNQIEACNYISQKSSVIFHNSLGLNKFAEEIEEDLDKFMSSSRTRAQQAQLRELATVHRHEHLETTSKSSITISNLVGGQYFFTVDEVIIDRDNNLIYLIESKNTNAKILPSKADLKDGLLKMILYSNLKEIEVEYVGEQIKTLKPKPILKLTSPQIKESITSDRLDFLENWCTVHNIKSKSTRKFLQ
jgi:hypothetical protein